MAAIDNVVRLLGGDILRIRIDSDQNQLDATVTEALEQNLQATCLFMMISGTACLRTGWPRLTHHLKTRNNLHRMILLVFHDVPPANVVSLLQTLQSNTNIQNFKFTGSVPVGPLVSFLNAASTRLSAVSLDCDIEYNDNIGGPALLAASLQRLTNLESLELSVCRLQAESVVAIIYSLSRNQSVQTLKIDLGLSNQSALLASLTKLMRSTLTIRKLVINGAQADLRQTILTVAKSNFSLREISFGHRVRSSGVFSEKDQRLLRFYTNRNNHMDQWIKQPAAVPKHLWSNALYVAAQAGNRSVLFSSLLAISGDLAPGKRTRKRKRPRYYKPA